MYNKVNMETVLYKKIERMINMYIPYGTGELSFDIEKMAHSFEILESDSSQINPSKDESEIVKDALKSPINSKKLSELARGKKNAVIIISDHTRPVPSKHIIPHMLAQLREGNPKIEITLLVATGFHRLTTKEELVNKLGKEIVETEKIVIHDCQDESMLVDIGVLPSGARLIINKTAVETELLVSEGFIEPHFFAGFSGGRKSVLPGICSRKTVLGNHCAKFIDSPYARAGVLKDNPIHTDMEEACILAKLQFITNVIINGKKQVISAFAGHPFDAHEKGAKELLSQCMVKPKTKGDIAIASNGGAPLDQNVYQAVKGMTAAESAAKEDGVIIMCAKCDDGSGGDDFYKALRDCQSPEALLEEILKTPMDETEPDQWEAQILARILSKHKVIFVAASHMKQMLEEMKMTYSPSLEDAMEKAKEIKGEKSHVVVIVDGVSVIVGENNK